MRRVAAILHHRKAGFKANAMGVWDVPIEELKILPQKWHPLNQLAIATGDQLIQIGLILYLL